MLDKPVSDWSGEDVQTFLLNTQEKYGLKDASVNWLVEQEFDGRNLLMITEDRLIRCGMKAGPACKVMYLIEALKLAKGLSEPGK